MLITSFEQKETKVTKNSVRLSDTVSECEIRSNASKISFGRVQHRIDGQPSRSGGGLSKIDAPG
jgi:hypothetical protein